MGPELVREVLERGHAVVVLPFDPKRNQVVLIEQFRIGALGVVADPWLVEPVAGIIEPGEQALEVARREAARGSRSRAPGPGAGVQPISRARAAAPRPARCSSAGSMPASAGGIFGLAARRRGHQGARRSARRSPRRGSATAASMPPRRSSPCNGWRCTGRSWPAVGTGRDEVMPDASGRSPARLPARQPKRVLSGKRVPRNCAQGAAGAAVTSARAAPY